MTFPSAEPGRVVPDGPRGLTAGIALVGVGLYMLASQRFGFRGAGPILLLLGAIFFALSATRRFRGPLLPAGVLLGLGAGMMLREPFEPWMPHWSTILLGLGAGFLLVTSIDRAAGRRRQPPPIIPGLVLVGIAIGGAALRTLSVDDLLDRFEPIWPFLLLAAGVALVVASRRRRRA